MDERHLLSGLMKAVAEEREEYVVRPLSPGLKKFAAFAYVAARFGYRYMGHAPGNAALNNPYFRFQRTPDARERAASLTVGHPGGMTTLPGMIPGRGLTPAPDAQTEVDLFYSQMVVDACGRYNRRVVSNLLLFPLAAAVFLAFPGYTTERVLIAGGIWIGFLALYLAGRLVTRYRFAKHLAHLRDAGVEWPPPKQT